MLRVQACKQSFQGQDYQGHLTPKPHVCLIELRWLLGWAIYLSPSCMSHVPVRYWSLLWKYVFPTDHWTPLTDLLQNISKKNSQQGCSRSIRISNSQLPSTMGSRIPGRGALEKDALQRLADALCTDPSAEVILTHLDALTDDETAWTQNRDRPVADELFELGGWICMVAFTIKNSKLETAGSFLSPYLLKPLCCLQVFTSWNCCVVYKSLHLETDV